MSFKAINWTPNEKLAERKTDQLATNAQWLYDNTPRAIYTVPGGINRVEGVKMAAGRVIIPKKTKTDSASTRVSFGNFFTTSCQPIITTGIVADFQSRIFCTIHGIGTLHPDNNGFVVGINIAAEIKRNDHIASSFYVAWQAMGY